MQGDRPRVLFLSFCPTVSGVTMYQAAQMRHLADRADVFLVDEHPRTTLSHMNGDAASFQARTIPLWTDRAAAAAELRGWLDRHRPHVIAVSNPGVLLLYRALLRRARRTYGSRVVLTQHSGVLTMTPRRLVMELGAAVAARGVDDIVYVSAFTRRYWQRRYPWLRRVPGRVVPNGVVPCPSAQVRTARSPVRVGFVGRLEREKGIDLFCEVARAFARSGEAAEFHAFGAGTRGEALGRAYPEVRWHGHQEQPALIYGSVDLLLVTSPVENSPFAVLEAKSMGVPTVSAPVGGLPELVEDGVDGILAPRRTRDDLAAALRRASGALPALSAGCLRTRHRFDLRATAGATWAPYLGTE
jgi:glycosyltransferase involved in cell wall biosynthesis